MLYSIKTPILHSILAQGCASNAINNKKYTTSNDKEIYLSATVARELRNERSGTTSSKHTYTWSKLESGNQYLVLVKSDKTNSNGNFMYLSPDDKYAHTDAASVGLDLIGSKLTDDDKSIYGL